MTKVVSWVVAGAVAASGLSAQVPSTRMVVKSPVRISPAEISRVPRDGSHIVLAAGAFDPLRQRIDAKRIVPAKSASAYVILQFRAGKLGAKAELSESGVEFHGYLPDNAFLARVPSELRQRVARHSAVRWIGEYEPGFRVSPRLWRGEGRYVDAITVTGFSGVSLEKIATILEREFGVRRLHLLNDPVTPFLRLELGSADRDAVIARAAAFEGVAWVEPFDRPQVHNINSSGPIQGNAELARTIFARGITGTGQIVAVADSGLDSDMCFFRSYNGLDAVTAPSNTIQPELGPMFPSNKVFAHWVQDGADGYDTNAACPGGSSNGFHGTHTAGSAAGDNPLNRSTATSAGIDTGDGMAPNAQLLFQDIADSLGCFDSGLKNPYGTFKQAHDAGAGIHSNSYGEETSGHYSTDDQTVDRFLFDHDRMTVFFSAGNNGPGDSSIGSPGNAKNVITVGATGGGTSPLIASFSSRGPTADGRIKPDITAPGQGIVSASGNTLSSDANCGVTTKSGTSMSTPIVAGGAALARQYFVDGFYPSGSRNPDDSLEPTAPLMKAVLLNGTHPLPSAGAFGNGRFGWGRIFLDNNLYFPGDARKLRVWSLRNVDGLVTGETRSYQVNVAAGQEFRATLAWSDPEGALGAATTLVNDLDLQVVTPAGEFLGNVLSAAGESTTGGVRDTRNNVEQVRFSAPVAGTYTVRVVAMNVPGNGRTLTDRQGFGLAVSAAACQTSVTTAPGGIAATSNAVRGIDLTWTPAPGSNVTQIYRSSQDGKGGLQFVGSSTTGRFTDDRAQGGVSYTYRLRGADNCGEGPATESVTVIPLGGCDVPPRFTGLESVATDGALCSIGLSWRAAESMCPLGPSVRYNVYRSTTPYVFTDQPVATITGTSYVDNDVTNDRTYYYMVRAEDTTIGSAGPHGGNEDANDSVRFATPRGTPSGELGTWTDDGGDTRAQLSAQWPWRVSNHDAASGEYSYRSSDEGARVPSDLCASVTTPELLLGPGAELRYSVRYNLEHLWDGVVVEISTDQGATWTDLPPAGNYPASFADTGNPPLNACGFPSSRRAFSGPAGNVALTPWTEYSSSLGAWAGQRVMIRWRLSTDPAIEFDAFHLDSISVTNVRVPRPCVNATTAPQASFTYAPSLVHVGTTVAFTDTSLNMPSSWLWEFGDGATSTDQNPAYAYAAPGTYLVKLTSANAAGSTEFTREVVVLPQPTGRRRAVR